MRALPRSASEPPRWGRGCPRAEGSLTHPTAPRRRAAGGRRRRRLRPGGAERHRAAGTRGSSASPYPLDTADLRQRGGRSRIYSALPARPGVSPTAARAGICAPRGQTHGRRGPASSYGCQPGRPAPPGRLSPPRRRDSGLQSVKRVVSVPGPRGARRRLGPSAPGRRTPERSGAARGAHERRWQRLSPAR